MVPARGRLWETRCPLDGKSRESTGRVDDPDLDCRTRTVRRGQREGSSTTVTAVHRCDADTYAMLDDLTYVVIAL